MSFVDTNQCEVVAPIVATKFEDLTPLGVSGFEGRRATWTDSDGNLKQGFCLDPNDYAEFFKFELETIAAEATLADRIEDLRRDTENRLTHLGKLKNMLIFQIYE